MKNVGIIKENFDLAHKFTKLLNIKEMNAVELPLYNSVHINSLVLSAAKESQMGGQQAVIEFGEGFTNYPDSIKGPDNLLKLGLSFSNLNKKSEACSAFYELEIKYKNSPKNVLERSQEERKKLKCPKE